MDWLSILTSFGAFVTGGGLIQFIHWQADKRKANAEADQAEQQTDSIAIDALNKTITALRDGDVAKDAMIVKQATDLDNQKNINFDVRNENTACKLLMCVHLGCIIREPLHGQGDTWYDGHKSDPTLGADYLPINQLLIKYGKGKDGNDKQ